MRLSHATLDRLPAHIARPGYDRTQRAGIVHFGIGAFHRAHQAVYTDDALAQGDRDWGIVGVSLRSADVAAQLTPQDGLYTVAQRGAGGSARVIGAVRRVLVAPEDPEVVISALASPDTHIVSFTITEKGYRRGADGSLDVTAGDVAHDLHGGRPRTIYGFLATAFARRRAAGLSGLTLLSCDNLAENGVVLSSLLGAFLERADAATAAWFRAHCTCPSTMVDRIVPATTTADIHDFANATGLRDEALVVTEPFRQWVIEDRFAGPRPLWEAGGAQLVADVRPYEVAKLRMLNGAHSALAYLGLARGCEYVHQAVADPAIRLSVDGLMRLEAAATLDALPGFDSDAYADALLARFANPALPHRLAQIAMDGSQKIPQRWLAPLAMNQRAGRDCPATLAALAAWMLHIRDETNDDPKAAELASAWRANGGDGIAAALFGPDGLFAAHWTATPGDLATLSRLARPA